MTDIEAAFAAAKQTCHDGHHDETGQTCSYGGMSPSYGYWLAADECPLNHGELCDLRAACDGAEAETGFVGHDPDPETLYWIWAVMACQPCADLWVAARPEWQRKPPPAADLEALNTPSALELLRATLDQHLADTVPVGCLACGMLMAAAEVKTHACEVLTGLTGPFTGLIGPLGLKGTDESEAS